MGDLGQEEGLGGLGENGGEDDWDEGDESLDTSLEDGFDDPDELADDGDD
jgi:hypothetical protein